MGLMTSLVFQTNQFGLSVFKPFTIALWVKLREKERLIAFIGHDEGGGALNKWIILYDELSEDENGRPTWPTLRFHINSPLLSSIDPVVSFWDPIISEWYHVAVTRNNNLYSLFVNGKSVSSGTDDNEIPNPNWPLTIGQAEGFFINGVIDDVRIYNRALSEDEIRMLYGIENPVINPDNGHLYQRFDTTMTWHDAKNYCESIGGYLATITSLKEQNFVYDNLGSVSPNDCWLGGTDEDLEGEWSWITGENWGYNNWRSGEPNDCGNEDYLSFFTPNSWSVGDQSSAGLWNDQATGNNGACSCGYCSELWPMSTICEWDESENKPITIQAEDYDAGGQHIGYFDKTPGNAGGQYRQDDVDIWRSGPNTYYTGANATGEWQNYTIDVPHSGDYLLEIRVATPNSNRRVHVEFDGCEQDWAADRS